MPRYFVDALGAPRYFDVVKEALPPGMLLGILMRFFDTKETTAWHVVEWALANGHDVRAHGVWVANHKHGRKEIVAAIKRAERFNELAKAHPTQRIYYSPFLEWDSIEGGAGPAFKKVIAAAPLCKIVNCGPGNIQNTIKEVHYRPGRVVPAGAFVSTDGIDHRTIRDSGYDSDARKALFQGSWCSHNNGRSKNGPALPIDKRKEWTTVKQFREQLRMLNA